MRRRIATKSWRIGWFKDNKWHYLMTNSRAEMIDEVADKTIISDRVSVRAISGFRIEEDSNED